MSTPQDQLSSIHCLNGKLMFKPREKALSVTTLDDITGAEIFKSAVEGKSKITFYMKTGPVHDHVVFTAAADKLLATVERYLITPAFSQP